MYKSGGAVPPPPPPPPLSPTPLECMFTAQGPSVFHAIEVAVAQFAQGELVYSYNIVLAHSINYMCHTHTMT